MMAIDTKCEVITMSDTMPIIAIVSIRAGDTLDELLAGMDRAERLQAQHVMGCAAAFALGCALMLAVALALSAASQSPRCRRAA